MRNVMYHFSDNIVVHIRTLSGELDRIGGKRHAGVRRQEFVQPANLQCRNRDEYGVTDECVQLLRFCKLDVAVEGRRDDDCGWEIED